MTALSIGYDPSASGWPLIGWADRLLRRLSAFMRFRHYPGQRRMRAQAAMRWLADYVGHRR
jgi:hypothetical protein